MADYKLLVYTNAAPGQDDAFNTWYDDIHLGEVYQVDGISTALRYDILEKADDDVLPHRYLAIYELSTDDPQGVLKELSRRARSGVFNMSPSLADPVLTLIKQR
ncbi:MAG: hypothetical protein ABW039_03135 [Sphingobium sp.]